MPTQPAPQDWERTIAFKVDVAGVIHIMGSALYSRPSTAIRELIQNAHDAIMRRRRTDLGYQGRIDIIQCPELNVVEIHDDGIGLNAEEAETYLGTLGLGITGILKGEHPQSERKSSNASGLIGQFGIGLFSAFMLADEIEVISRRDGGDPAIRWRAGAGTEILLSSAHRDSPGTTVRLHLLPHQRGWSTEPEELESAIEQYADFLPIPIYLNRGKARVNVMQTHWFDPSPEPEMLEQELAAYFDESPLDVIPIHANQPVTISGALYVSPQRTPGFTGDSDVMVTVMRMVISHRISDLIPAWASFLRGVLELSGCRPTASREDLVRDGSFEVARSILEEKVFEHLEGIAESDRLRFESILNWHRYTLVGASLFVPRLRQLLTKHYRFATSRGDMALTEILHHSNACPIRDYEYQKVVWFNSDRRQERWLTGLFAHQDAPCVHTFRSFEESLLASMIADASDSLSIDLRLAHPSSTHFAAQIVQAKSMEPASPEWSSYLESTNATIYCAEFRDDVPVMSFLNERDGLKRTFEDLKQQGAIPSGFQRIIDRQLGREGNCKNEVILNRRHRLVARALQQSTRSPIASVLRLLVLQSLTTAGATIPRDAQDIQVEDLDWIADALWGKH